nr:TonB-dependent receptor plug domain-containing protein [Cricetibacter osteomyelitidis]
MVVSSTPFSQQVGTQKITEEQIKNRPTGNGNVTELLKNNPSVRFANRADSSNTAGEIAPNEVSIHGEKFYNNNYTIDGLSNNDNINPGANNGQLSAISPDGYSPNDLPAGGTQSFWLDTGLLKNVEVFDSNISAKYGNFTGGVINAEIKDPSFDRHKGRVFYRTSRDAWAHYFIDEADKEEFYQATKIYNQPQFKKEQYGIEVNQPLNEKAALLFSYNRTESKMPFYDTGLQEWQNQSRMSETYLLKGIYLPENGDLWRATLMYSPHESKYPKQYIKNGYFTNTGGGISFNLDWERDLSWAKMKTQFGYKRTGNEIEHEGGTTYHDYHKTASIDWCSVRNSSGTCIRSRIGGYGTYSTKKETYSVKQDYEVNAFDTGSIEHKIGFGWQVDLANAKYKRDSDVYTYSKYSTTNAANVTNCTECIAGEQYATTRTWFPARNVKAQDNVYSFYLEDSMQWKRLNVIFGLRFDRSQFLSNNDIAPRFSTSYDVFGNKKTHIFAGLNRYYASSILAYKLRNGIGTQITQKRTLSGTSLTDWTTTASTTGSVSNSYDVSGLKTPYSDEILLGFSQKIGNSLWTLKWVHRKGRDQFTRSTEYDSNGKPRYRKLVNGGGSENHSFTLSASSLKPIEFKYAKIDWELGASVTRSKSNNMYYDATSLDHNGVTKAIYDNKWYDIDGLPSLDYNTPWDTFLSINTYFPGLRLNWNQRFSYTAAYTGYTRSTLYCADTTSSRNALCGNYYDGDVYNYVTKKYSNAFILDWRFSYKQLTFKEQFLEITVDINNVLNRKVAISSPTGTTATSGTSYKLGRNFWLGVSYNW